MGTCLYRYGHGHIDMNMAIGICAWQLGMATLESDWKSDWEGRCDGY